MQKINKKKTLDIQVSKYTCLPLICHHSVCLVFFKHLKINVSFGLNFLIIIIDLHLDLSFDLLLENKTSTKYVYFNIMYEYRV